MRQQIDNVNYKIDGQVLLAFPVQHKLSMLAHPVMVRMSSAMVATLRIQNKRLGQFRRCQFLSRITRSSRFGFRAPWLHG